ncbi:MAG TPA: ATP-grasp domain-containing protein [Solirubrobacteraceae bacterium]|nr:ATP-grasp domain-containing protein [Solirubrobacteraceae bacterium]
MLAAAAILPGTEASLIALSRARESMPCPVGAPRPEIVELATDKGRVLELAAGFGLAVPPSIVAAPAELAQRCEELGYPSILKPLRTRTELGDSRLAYYKARRVASASELKLALADLPPTPWVVQPYLPGKLSAVSGVAWEGRLFGTVHQVSHRIWPADVGYSTYAETVEADGELDTHIAELLAAIGWSGIFQAQFLGDHAGGRFLIDFNPRAYGSLALAVRAGANLPAIWAKLVLGGRPDPPAYRPGVRYRLEHSDVRALARRLREGDVKGTIAGMVPRRRTVHAIFSLRDPGPLLTTGSKLLGRRTRG